MKSRSEAGPAIPDRLTPPFQSLGRRVRDLMLRCFEHGHMSPRLRPDAATWHFILYRAEKGLQQCSRNPRHQFADRLRQCPWCRHAQRTGIDLFAE